MQNLDQNQSQNLDDAINTLRAGEAAGRESVAADNGAVGAETAFNVGGNGPEIAADNEFLSDNADSVPDLAAAENEEEIESDVSELQAEISNLRGQLEISSAESARFKDQALRALAEAENVRKRAAQDIDREKKFALEKFVRSLLPVYDALEKAVEMTDSENEATKATYDGVVNTLNLFVKEMSTFGVEVTDPTGKPFDPNFHQAVAMVPSTEVPSGHVLNTMQKGFLLNGRVVRPAMVIVAKVE